MTALLVILQFATKSLGQIVTGSCVNFVLASTVLICGTGSAVVVALLSPLFAFLLGIGPAFLPIVPCICVGNCVLVVVLRLISGKEGSATGKVLKAVSVAVSAAAKFLVLYLLVAKITIPLLGLPDNKAAIVSASFSWPQLFTALIGTSIAMLVCPRIQKGINKKQ